MTTTGWRVPSARLSREEQRLDNLRWLHAQRQRRLRHGRRVADVGEEGGVDVVGVEVVLEIGGSKGRHGLCWMNLPGSFPASGKVVDYLR